MASYCKLESGKGFLKTVDFGAGETITPAEVVKSEEWALEQVDAVLGKRWSTDIDDDVAGTPKLIREIAEQLAASRVLKRSHAGNLDRLDAAQALEDDAMKELLAVRAGKKGIKLRNGSWDPKYPGSNNKEEGRPGGGLRILCG